MDQFDLNATRVYAALCHLTGGDHRAADELLIAAYRIVPAGRATTLQWLIFVAHHLALGQTALGQTSTFNRTDELAFWANLSAPQRVAIHLRLVERFSVAEIAHGFGLAEADVSTLIAQGLRQCPTATTGSDLVRWLRPTESWLGDDVRNQLRPASTPAPRPTPAATHRLRRRSKTTMTAVAAVVLFVGIIVLSKASSGDRSAAVSLTAETAASGRTTAATTAATNAATNAATTAATTAETGTEATVQPAFSEMINLANTVRFPGGGPSNVTFFTDVDLPDRQLVVPDAIVLFPNRKVGLTWTSPCNRAANFVTLTNLPDGLGLQLFTGAIDIRSCTGMPSRWTAVFQMLRDAGSSIIVPVSDEGLLDLGYQNSYTAGDNSASSSATDLSSRSYAALVDADDQPWYYGTGCVTPTVVRFESPIGPIFETIATLPDQSIGSTSDYLTCVALAKRPVLRSPDGLNFPRLFGRPIDRVDCRGPEGSFRDLYNVGDDGVDKSTSNWTSWDGCLVRGDVISETDLARACGIPGARALMVNIGGQAAVYINLGTTALPDALLEQLRPADAYDTGLAHNSEELWLSPSHPEFAYIVDGVSEMAWPAVGLTCRPTS